MLFSLASAVGHPLKLDEPTSTLSRPSVARVCVEVYLLKDLQKRVWIGVDDSDFYQTVTYDDSPAYCVNCKKISHSSSQCRKQAQNQPVLIVMIQFECSNRRALSLLVFMS